MVILVGLRNYLVFEIFLDSSPVSFLWFPMATASCRFDLDDVSSMENDCGFHRQSGPLHPTSLFLVESNLCFRSGSASKEAMRPVSSSLCQNCYGSIIGQRLVGPDDSRASAALSGSGAVWS